MIMIIFGCWQWPQRNDLAGVDDLLGAALYDGLVDCGLEAILVDHQARSGEARDLPRGELQVVRLRAWGGQTGDRRMVTRDALGDKLERVEGGHNAEPARVLCLRAGCRSGVCTRCCCHERQQAGE